MTEHDTDACMMRALELARRGQGYVEPNPMVGAVVVRDEQIVGEGYHQKYGGPHAEVNALRQAGDKARGATLVVTLEPCCHQGKTPPCTEAVIAAGIRSVIVAGPDPNPLVAGKGLNALHTAGIEVTIGCKRGEAEQLNAPFYKLIKSGKPYVIAKWAMTLDGRIATATGDSKWISNEVSRAKVHELRGRVDGIIVGIGTVLADDPLLTARPPGPRTATRIVLDNRLRIPVTSHLVSSAKEYPTLLVHQRQIDLNIDAETLPDDTSPLDYLSAGCELICLQGSRRSVLQQLMDVLGKRKMTNVLIEGGAQVLGAAFDAGIVDEAWVFVAPKIIGSAEAPGPVAGHGVSVLKDAMQLGRTEVEQLNGDVLLRVYRHTNHF